jgi:hypothetical protein
MTRGRVWRVRRALRREGLPTPSVWRVSGTCRAPQRAESVVGGQSQQSVRSIAPTAYVELCQCCKVSIDRQSTPVLPC